MPIMDGGKSSACAGVMSPSTELDDIITRVLRKGDLVRIQKMNDTRLKHRDGALGRINSKTPIPQQDLDALPDDSLERHPFLYDIDFILGGKITNCHRRELLYTTAEAEGMISNGASARVQRKRKPSSVVREAKEVEAVKKKKIGPKQTPAKNGGKSSPAKKGKGKAGNPTTKTVTSGKRKAPAAKTVSAKKAKAVEVVTEVHILEDDPSIAKDLYEKHKKDFERSLTRLEKLDHFGFFYEAPPEAKKEDTSVAVEEHLPIESSGVSQVLANNGQSNDQAEPVVTIETSSLPPASHAVPPSDVKPPTTVSSGEAQRVSSSTSRMEDIQLSNVLPEKELSSSSPELISSITITESSNAQRESTCSAGQPLHVSSSTPQEKENGKPPPTSPEPVSRPPRTWSEIREQKEAGRYELDRLTKLERERQKRLGPYKWERRKKKKQQELEGNKKIETWELNEISTSNQKAKQSKRNLTINGVRVHPRVLHPKGVHWELFRSDILAMCDAAIARDPQGTEGRHGTPGNAAKKIKDLLGQIYEKIAKKHMLDMETADARHEFTVLLKAAPNLEAAFQGDWRTTPFPERQYERLRSDVLCSGLSSLDQKSASHEKRTALPDSFVGLSYTYNDTGQSEGWMKSVFETANSKSKDGFSEEEKAANALAADDGVVRAQVRATMRTLLIGVQDKVLTDAGVLKYPELHSANWDLPGIETQTQASAEVCSKMNSDDSALASTLLSISAEEKRPDLVEQSVWGMDCYTRRNVLVCIEHGLDPETAIEFLEKWLLPAINACPIDLAHDLKNAAKLLEGLPLYGDENDAMSLSKSMQPEQTGDKKSKVIDTDTSDQKSKINGTDSSPDTEDKKLVNKKDESWSNSLLGQALLHKIRSCAPPWLKAAAYQLRRAITSLGHDFFRVHPKGHGSIVLSPKVQANTLVTFYRGEVYPSWRWGEKMDAIEMTQQHIGLRPNLPDFYNMALERPQSDPKGYGLMIVDASRKAGHGSMLSHSCDPTCEVRVAALNGQLCLAMTTLRDIEQGEELTFDYNAVTESLDEYQAAVCLCGNSKCRGSFLHFATADCYQQVLNRNSPMAIRFTNLVKGCTKQVMSEDDEKTLQTHGFGTAAFGAVSFIRDLDDASDSMDNVPVWLRTYVADVLRYIEYERRALPIALLCDHFKTDKSTAEEASPVQEATKGKKKEKEDKPQNCFQFFVTKNTDRFMQMIGEEALKKMKGMEVQQNLRTCGSAAWKKLTDAQKAEWKEQAINDWKAKKSASASKATDDTKEVKAKVEKREPSQLRIDKKQDKKPSQGKGSDNLNLSRISFEAADAEGVSAMEQRIQQLTQALSRIGRVLDRHREHCASLLQSSEMGSVKSKLHEPLSIMTDCEVICWMWCHERGVVKSLLKSVKSEKCVDPSLYYTLIKVTENYPDLDVFVSDPQKCNFSASHARTILTEALLRLRECLHDGVQELAKEHKRHELQKGRMKAKARRDDVKLAVKNQVRSVLNDIIDQVLLSCGEAESAVAGIKSGLAVEPNEKLSQSQEKPNGEVLPMEPWLEHYSDRWKLEAAADILLMYARTTTFFKIVPYTPLESTPLEVYARELGNVVPRSKIKNAQNAKIQESTHIVLLGKSSNDSNPSQDDADEASNTVRDDKKGKQKEELCDPDEAVANVTVSYSGEYVVSQLLQWFNGGIGQKQGLPDMLGCVILPSIEETWKSSALPSGRNKKTTFYRSLLRPRLFDWLRDPHQRGSSFPEDLAKVFKSSELVYQGDKLELLPFGSPVLDFLVGGEDANIHHVLAALDRERLRDGTSDAVKDSATNRLESAVDEEMPAQAVAKWVQCENPKCLKWRRLPFFVDVDVLPEKFFCKDNTWNVAAQSCDSPEDMWDENDTNVQNGGVPKASDESMVKQNENVYPAEILEPSDKYEIGQRYDVLRSGKKFYCTGEVVDIDFKDGKKRVKFHYPKVPEKYDEWFEVPSDSIAPLQTKQLTKAERERAKQEEKERLKSLSKNAATKNASESVNLVEGHKDEGKAVSKQPVTSVVATLLALRNVGHEGGTKKKDGKETKSSKKKSAKSLNKSTQQKKTEKNLTRDERMNDLFDTDSEDEVIQNKVENTPTQTTSQSRSTEVPPSEPSKKKSFSMPTNGLQALIEEPTEGRLSSMSISKDSKTHPEIPRKPKTNAEASTIAKSAASGSGHAYIPRKSKTNPEASTIAKSAASESGHAHIPQKSKTTPEASTIAMSTASESGHAHIPRKSSGPETWISTTNPEAIIIANSKALESGREHIPRKPAVPETLTSKGPTIPRRSLIEHPRTNVQGHNHHPHSHYYTTGSADSGHVRDRAPTYYLPPTDEQHRNGYHEWHRHEDSRVHYAIPNDHYRPHNGDYYHRQAYHPPHGAHDPHGYHDGRNGETIPRKPMYHPENQNPRNGDGSYPPRRNV